MTHQFIFDKLKEIVPQYAENVVTWYPNGRNSVRVITNNKREFIFSYEGDKDWRFETVKSYIKKVKKEDKR